MVTIHKYFVLLMSANSALCLDDFGFVLLLFILQGSGEDTEGLCDIIEAIAEVIKLTDPSLLYLEVSTLVSKYPDIR